MIALLLNLLVVALVISVFYYCLTLLPLPAVAKQIATILLVLIFLLWFLNAVGVFGGTAWTPLRWRG